jgi:hypothetical protein
MTARYVPRNLQGLPTLTEVIEVSAPAVAAAPQPRLAEQGEVREADAPATTGPDLDEAQIAASVLLELQRHAELMLEQRLREAIGPALARAADTLVDELRDELAATLRDVVARSVSQEIARQRER